MFSSASASTSALASSPLKNNISAIRSRFYILSCHLSLSLSLSLYIYIYISLHDSYPWIFLRDSFSLCESCLSHPRNFFRKRTNKMSIWASSGSAPVLASSYLYSLFFLGKTLSSCFFSSIFLGGCVKVFQLLFPPLSLPFFNSTSRLISCYLKKIKETFLFYGHREKQRKERRIIIPAILAVNTHPFRRTIHGLLETRLAHTCW